MCKSILLQAIVSAYKLECNCKYTIESALIDMISNVDITFLETSSLWLFYEHPQISKYNLSECEEGVLIRKHGE